MDDGDKHQRWKRYYANTGERPPRKTLLLALERFAGEGLQGGQAIDLGCGSGRDTIAMLRQGWRVLAIDAEPEAFAALKAREDLPADAALETLEPCSPRQPPRWTPFVTRSIVHSID